MLGTGWDPILTCRAGNDFFTEYRFVLEFPLDALPEDATITGATLAIRAATGAQSGQTAVLGYAGDGTVAANDVQVAGAPVLITPATDLRETYDVGSLMSPQMVVSGWAGFSFRHAPLVGSIGTWDCPDSADFPILTVEYSLLPPATPTPTATPTMTPSTSPSQTPGEVLLPDTRTHDPRVGGADRCEWPDDPGRRGGCHRRGVRQEIEAPALALVPFQLLSAARTALGERLEDGVDLMAHFVLGLDHTGIRSTGCVVALKGWIRRANRSAGARATHCPRCAHATAWAGPACRLRRAADATDGLGAMRARLVDRSLGVDPALVLVLKLMLVVVARAKGALGPVDQAPVVVRHCCCLERCSSVQCRSRAVSGMQADRHRLVSLR